MSSRAAAVAGGTGLVGSQLLQVLLAEPTYSQVVAVGRRPAPLEDPKLLQVKADFADPQALERALPRLDDAFCCLGTTRKVAGSAEAFRAVDFDACLSFARAARARGAQRFLLVSSLGANAKSRLLYSRVKGEIEQAVQGLGFEQVELLRPSILDGDRKQARPGERVGLAMMRGVARVAGERWRYAPIRDQVVARAMVRLALSGGSGARVHLSDALQRLGR